MTLLSPAGVILPGDAEAHDVVRDLVTIALLRTLARPEWDGINERTRRVGLPTVSSVVQKEGSLGATVCGRTVAALLVPDSRVVGMDRVCVCVVQTPAEAVVISRRIVVISCMTDGIIDDRSVRGEVICKVEAIGCGYVGGGEGEDLG